jgi:hypothetical protein
LKSDFDNFLSTKAEKFKQGGSTIPTISTKQTITSHLNSMNIKKTMTYEVGYPGPGLGQAQKYGRVSNCHDLYTDLDYVSTKVPSLFSFVFNLCFFVFLF